MKYASIDIETLGLDPSCCDTIEFGCVLDDLKERESVESLPTFHCYLTRPRNMYRGDAFAMSMHQKILRRIADREEGYSYIPYDLLDEVFSDWLQDQGVDNKLVIAGKNFAAFDLQFLKVIGFGAKTKYHHRGLDPGSMFFDPNIDDVPPGLEKCMERAGCPDLVKHTAVEDALDVVRCVRAAYPLNTTNRTKSTIKEHGPYSIEERLQDENLGIVERGLSLSGALAYITRRRGEPLGKCSMFTIFDRNGQKVEVPL